MKHDSEVAARTRKKLMDAFWELYSQERIEKISVREIVSKAGCNRSTFYEYFTDVYDVLEQIEAPLLPVPEGHRDMIVGPDFHLPLDQLAEVYRSNKTYYVVLLGKSGDPAFREKIKNVSKTLLRPHLQLPGADDFAMECTLEYAVSAVITAMTYCYMREEEPDLERMAQLILGLMNDGVMKSFKWDVPGK